MPEEHPVHSGSWNWETAAWSRPRALGAGARKETSLLWDCSWNSREDGAIGPECMGDMGPRAGECVRDRAKNPRKELELQL